jgi:PPK2 family polyphosphate:nucleotide phosphotransferase
MKISTKEFRVREGGKVRLKKLPTKIKPFYKSDEHYKQLLAAHIKELSERQDLLYAHDRYALLLIFQAMDAAGKDGAIKHVMSGLNPQGCQVYSFKQPSAEELAHDFLWRTTRCLPARGHIGIFNRSYYEEVLILRVHPKILRGECLPEELTGGKDFWEKRYRSINDLEKHLHRNGTRVVKFFLHLSKDEQRRRFLRRVEDPARNWKFSPSDLAERGFWKQYQSAYENCLAATSTGHAPWFVVPADDKLNARLIISQVVLNVLRDLKMKFPKPDELRLKELRALKKQLAK